MGFTGGDVLEITYNHSTVGSGTLYVKSNEDTTFDLGGKRANDDANMVTGNGSMINQINQTRWSFEGTIAWDMTGANESKRMAELSASPELADWTIEHISGAIYGGKGTIVGDIAGSGNNATIPIKIAGGGQLNRIG
jgi:hypothetical protein